MNILQRIFEHKQREVHEARSAISLPDIKARAADAPPVRPFRRALESPNRDLGLIAEVKQASPSKGVIRENFDPIEVALAYAKAGADCLSVLTDEKYFQGSLRNLQLAREASGLPCLRKDFICDEYQVYEARAWGADCILLIAAGFDRANRSYMTYMHSLARELGMDALIEVHDEAEVEAALAMKAELIGVNNRNLADMSTSLSISERLLPLIAPHALAVSESALATRVDLDRVKAAGAKAVLIGTTFCAASDIEAKVREVMGAR